MRRNIRERVADARAVPHLRPRPLHRHRRRRPAVVDDGRASRRRTRYPYARHYRLGRDRINYMRNSVKAVDRRLRRHDDVLRVRHRGSDHRRLSRDLPDACSRTRRRCRPTCAQHVRYPELLLAAAGGRLRPVPHDRSRRCSTTARISGPSPAEVGDERAARAERADDGAELRADEAAGRAGDGVRRDPAVHAGQPEQPDRLDCRPQRRAALRQRRSSTTFPRRRLVDGPLQIEARIDQNAQLSGQLSLWNQQGSQRACAAA